MSAPLGRALEGRSLYDFPRPLFAGGFPCGLFCGCCPALLEAGGLFELFCALAGGWSAFVETGGLFELFCSTAGGKFWRFLLLSCTGIEVLPCLFELFCSTVGGRPGRFRLLSCTGMELLPCAFRGVPGCAGGAILMFERSCITFPPCARRISETPGGLPPLA